MDKSANTLRKLKNQHIFDPSKPDLYIHREYSAEAFHDNEVKPGYNNILRKVRNNLTAAMNKYPGTLPNFIIILVSNKYAHDSTFVEFEFKAILKRVLNDVGRLLATRRDQLPRKAQNLRGNTEVFVIRPLPKPATALKGDLTFKNARRSMNQMLDKLSLTLEFKPLNIDAINCTQKILFEKNGDLSDYGKERMWQSISDFIKTKDNRLEKAWASVSVAKENAEAQVTPEIIQEAFRQKGGRHGGRSRNTITGTASADGNTEQYDRYYTNNQTRSNQDQWGQWENRRFDNYHRDYDRDDYRGHYQGSSTYGAY